MLVLSTKKRNQNNGEGSQSGFMESVNVNVNKNCINKSKKGNKNGNVNNCDVVFKRGLKVGSINVSKRIELNHWIELNDLDVICIQEWYVPHDRQVSENKDNDSEDDDSLGYDEFENERKNDQTYLTASMKNLLVTVEQNIV